MWIMVKIIMHPLRVLVVVVGSSNHFFNVEFHSTASENPGLCDTAPFLDEIGHGPMNLFISKVMYFTIQSV